MDELVQKYRRTLFAISIVTFAIVLSDNDATSIGFQGLQIDAQVAWFCMLVVQTYFLVMYISSPYLPEEYIRMNQSGRVLQADKYSDARSVGRQHIFGLMQSWLPIPVGSISLVINMWYAMTRFVVGS